MGYVNYRCLNFKQKLQARNLYPEWPLNNFYRFAFWIKNDGAVCRIKGRFRILDPAATTYDAKPPLPEIDWDDNIKQKYDDSCRSKGDLRDWVTARFHFSKG